jgi:hypothetical protein
MVEPISDMRRGALPSFQSFEIRNGVLTICGVRNGEEHPCAVNVACRVLQELIGFLKVAKEKITSSGGDFGALPTEGFGTSASTGQAARPFGGRPIPVRVISGPSDGGGSAPPRSREDVSGLRTKGSA